MNPKPSAPANRVSTLTGLVTLTVSLFGCAGMAGGGNGVCAFDGGTVLDAVFPPA